MVERLEKVMINSITDKHARIPPTQRTQISPTQLTEKVTINLQLRFFDSRVKAIFPFAPKKAAASNKTTAFYVNTPHKVSFPYSIFVLFPDIP